MARARNPLVEFAHDQVPLFADPERDYHWVRRYDGWERDNNAITLAARDESDHPLTVRLSFIEPAVLRVQLLTPGATDPPPTPMLIAADTPRLTLTVEEHEDGLRLRTSALVVDVDRDPWRLRVMAGGRSLYRQEIIDRAYHEFVAFPFGYSVRAGEVRVHETFALEVDEYLQGLGGQYAAVNKRGQRHTAWSRETAGTNTTPVTYMHVPFFMSSRGYGIFVNHGERATYELGYPSTVSASFAVDAPVLDYFLVAGPDPKAILRRYTALTGRPALPPLWSLGVWMSRCMYRDAAEVRESVTRMRALSLPVDVYHLDPMWLASRSRQRLDSCDFEWNHEAFGDPAALVSWLGEHGLKLSLWENPYVWRGSAMYQEGLARGFFASVPAGSPDSTARVELPAGAADNSTVQSAPPIAPTDYPDDAALIDYTNPDAVEWVKEKHRRLLRLGVASFKTDYGEGVPAEAVFANGQTGRTMHNLYPLLYTRAVFEASEEHRGAGEAVVFARSGFAGSQRYPLNWSGDTQSSWGGMAGALRCGLSQAMSGIAFWTADIGGFYAQEGAEIPAGTAGAGAVTVHRMPDPTLYIRWAQWGLLCSHSRFHGIGPREPWHYGAEAVRIVREFSRLRYRLLPYLWALAHEATESGVPVMRPLALEFPTDPVAAHIETQFMLGPSLLVCPVLNPEGQRRVYLPAGRWHDWWDGSVHEGPRHIDVTVPLDRLPLYVRDGSILPLGPAMEHTGAGDWDPLELQVRGEAAADVVVWTPRQRVPVRADRRNTRPRVRIENAVQRWRVRLVGVNAAGAGLTGAAVGFSWSLDGADTVAEFRMNGQGSAQMTTTLPPG